MNEDRREFLQFLGEHDTPAFLRRAQGVREAWNSVLQACRVQRDDLLEMPRMRLAVVAETIAHDWDALQDVLLDASIADQLKQFHVDWQPELRVPVQSIAEPKRWSRVIGELAIAFERFNKRWLEFAEEVNLQHVNAARDGYNKYYVIEKSCAFDSDRIGAEGFVELDPVTSADIIQELPLLPVPRLR